MQTSKLVHLFNIWALLFTVRAYAQENKSPKELVRENTFVFRVISEVYSLEDLKNYSQNLESFACMYKNSLVIDSFGFNEKTFSRIKNAKVDASFTQELKSEYDKFNRMVKMIKYLETQTIQVDNSLYSALKSSAKANKCLINPLNTFDSIMKIIIKAEVYFQSRFQDKSFWISETDLDTVMKKYPGKNRRTVKKIEERNRKQQSINLFIQSVEKQISDERFY